MRRRVLLAGLALSLSCGARTALLPGGPGGTGSRSSGGTGATPLAVKCAAALLDGAPTPMQGYCPTQANQASGLAPASPQVAWSVVPFAVDPLENFLPAAIVVDPSGRAYVAIDASPLNPTGGPNQIFAVDPDGSVAWTSSFGAPVAGLSLGSDGTLWLVEQPPSQGDGGIGAAGTVMGLSPDGATVTSLPLPELSSDGFVFSVGYDALALASDGSFFLEATPQDYSTGAIAHVTTAGAYLWQWPNATVNESVELVPPLLVGSDDGVVASNSGELLRFDASGNQVWEEDVDAQVAAIDASGYVLAISGESGDALSLVRIDPVGDTVLAVPLGTAQVNASQLALAGNGTTVVLLANEVTSPGLTKATVQILAIDASGATRWTTPLDVSLNYDPATLTTHYGLFVDGAGTVVVTAGAVTGIDLATGAILWTVQAPSAHSCLRPAVLGAGGAIVASQCDGTVFLARDP